MNVEQLATMAPAHSPERLLTRSEVAQIFGLSKRFLEVAAVKGGGPQMIKIGRSVRYRYRDVQEWIESRKVTSTSVIIVR